MRLGSLRITARAGRVLFVTWGPGWGARSTVGQAAWTVGPQLLGSPSNSHGPDSQEILAGPRIRDGDRDPPGPIVEAFPDNTAPSYLLRDRDHVYGHAFRHRVQGMGILEVLTAAQSPWQNPVVERLIGSVRRECLDHVLVLSERHRHRILTAYFAYYHRARTHLTLDKDTPHGRSVEGPEAGRVVPLREIGGLHHRYVRRAA
jgi:integrase-like protein